VVLPEWNTSAQAWIRLLTEATMPLGDRSGMVLTILDNHAGAC
jgi:hypothetical protein